MTSLELKNFIRATLVATRTIAQEISAFDEVIDFITSSLTTGIPAWTNALTFNTDGTGAGSFCTYPDTNGALRFWKTKTSANINNAPPTNPATTENTYWIEVSPSAGSAIQEWAAGVYGSGLVIVYHDHSTYGRGLYLLAAATRPFNSTNIETEITAGDWVRITTRPGEPARVQSVTSSATVTPNADTDDMVKITAQAAGLTLANPTGTPTEGQMIIIRIKDNGAARSIGYGSKYRALGITLPTTTVISKTLYLAMSYNITDDKWDVIGVRQEA